ncbi:MAG: ArnT family glycosyltransferase [Anaerolineae bacterium]
MEPLFIYMIAAFFRLGGVMPLAGRWIAALMGTATVPVLYLLVRELLAAQFPSGQGTWEVSSLAALSLAILYWHIHFSRVSIEPVLVPLFSSLSFYFLWRAFRTNHWRTFIVTGLLLGLSLYTYRVAWFLPPFLALFLAYRVFLEKGFLHRYGLRLVLLAIVALLTFAPLGAYLLTHPATLILRPSQVAVVATGQGSDVPLRAMAANAVKTLAMFSLKGDLNPRSNLPGRPALDAFLSIGFLVGVILSLSQWRRPAYVFLILWLGAMLLPTILSEYAPHFRRALGATPAVAILIAIGLSALLDGGRRLAGHLPRAWWGVVGLVPFLIVGGGLAVSAVTAYSDYFTVWGPSPDLYYAFDKSLVEVAEYARTLPGDETIYLSPIRSDHPTIVFTMGEEGRLKSFDGRHCLVLSAHPQRGTTYIVLVDEDDRSLSLLPRYLRDGEVAEEFKDRKGKLRAVAYRVPPGSKRTVGPQHPLVADLGGEVKLLGYDLEAETLHPGHTLSLTLYWQAQKKMALDYTAFVHLVGPYNPTTAGPLWGQHDSQPGGGTYPTTAWEAGEIVIDDYRVPIQADAPPGEYELEVGLYYLATMERVSVLDEEGEVQDDSIRLCTVEVVNGDDNEPGN